jgi:Fe-S-cluster-containing dehydrogenase component
MPKEDQDSLPMEGLSRRRFLYGSAIVTAGVSMSGMFPLANTPQAHAAQQTGHAAGQQHAMPAGTPAAKSLMVQRSNCTGCHSCVFACSLYHADEVRPAIARIHVRRFFGLVDVPILCWHCTDAPCVEACPVTPVKAIAKNKDTNVVGYTDEKLCLGASCNKCLEACPPQYLRRHPETAKPLFCDLCGGEPRCVQACARQSNETGETLRSDTRYAGLHRSYREVTPEEAAEGLMLKQFYPNLNGERR